MNKYAITFTFLLAPLAAQVPAGADTVAVIAPHLITWNFDTLRWSWGTASTQWGLPGDRFSAGNVFSPWQSGAQELIVSRRTGANLYGLYRLDHYVKRNSSSGLSVAFSGQSVVKRFGTVRPGAPYEVFTADFDGDGDDELCVFHQWRLDIDRDGSLTHTSNDSWYTWNIPFGHGDRIFGGRMFANSNRDHLVHWVKNLGQWRFYSVDPSTGRPNAVPAFEVQCALATDVPAFGDYNGDGMDDIWLWRTEPGDPDRNNLLINLWEAGAPNGGYGPNGDVDHVDQLGWWAYRMSLRYGWSDGDWRHGVVPVRMQ